MIEFLSQHMGAILMILAGLYGLIGLFFYSADRLASIEKEERE